MSSKAKAASKESDKSVSVVSMQPPATSKAAAVTRPTPVKHRTVIDPDVINANIQKTMSEIKLFKRVPNRTNMLKIGIQHPPPQPPPPPPRMNANLLSILTFF